MYIFNRGIYMHKSNMNNRVPYIKKKELLCPISAWRGGKSRVAAFPCPNTESHFARRLHPRSKGPAPPYTEL